MYAKTSFIYCSTINHSMCIFAGQKQSPKRKGYAHRY